MLQVCAPRFKVSVSPNCHMGLLLVVYALTAPPETSMARTPKAIYGLRPFPKRGGIVTNELIDKLREDDVY